MTADTITLRRAGHSVEVRVGQTVVMTDGRQAPVIEADDVNNMLSVRLDFKGNTSNWWYRRDGAFMSRYPDHGFPAIDLAATAALAAQRAGPDPIPMLLFCPTCGLQHVDAPEPDKGWTNPPHKSHLCHGCGCIWRPADVPTNGVAIIQSLGKHDTWVTCDPTRVGPAAPATLDADLRARCEAVERRMRERAAECRQQFDGEEVTVHRRYSLRGKADAFIEAADALAAALKDKEG